MRGWVNLGRVNRVKAATGQNRSRLASARSARFALARLAASRRPPRRQQARHGPPADLPGREHWLPAARVKAATGRRSRPHGRHDSPTGNGRRSTGPPPTARPRKSPRKSPAARPPAPLDLAAKADDRARDRPAFPPRNLTKEGRHLTKVCRYLMKCRNNYVKSAASAGRRQRLYALGSESKRTTESRRSAGRAPAGLPSESRRPDRKPPTEWPRNAATRPVTGAKLFAWKIPRPFSRPPLSPRLRAPGRRRLRALWPASGHSDRARELRCAKSGARIDALFRKPAGFDENHLMCVGLKGIEAMWSQVSTLTTLEQQQ